MGEHPYDGLRYRDIEVDGVSVAGDPPVLRTTQKVQGHVPLLLFKATTGRDARKAFILGLGTGEASSCIARHDVERVDCGELVAAEVGANHLFRHINNDILTQPKFNLIINDARNHLLTTSTTYDVIQSDSVHPMVAFNTYTKEYYELCRRRLSDRGIFSTWIPLFAFTEDNMRTLIRTLASVFPHVSVWWAPNYENKHAILIGTNHPLDNVYPTLKEEFSKPTIRASLDEVDLGDMARLLGTFVADETTLGDYARGAELNTDDNLHLSYQIPRNPRKGDETVPENLEAFARLGRSIVPYVRNLSPDERSRIGIDRHYAARTHVLSAMASYYRAKEGGEEGGFAEASSEYELALQATPDDPVLRRLLAEMKFFGGRARAEALSRTGKYAAAVAEYSSLIEIVPNNPWTYNSIAVCLDAMGRRRMAGEYLRKALEIAPDLVVARTNLAVHYWKERDLDSARREIAAAYGFNPLDVRVRRTAQLIEREPPP
jgi:spermidine synthase